MCFRQSTTFPALLLVGMLSVACSGPPGGGAESSTVATSSTSSGLGPTAVELPPVLVSYACEGTTTLLSAMFYNDRRPAELVLTWGQQTARLTQQPMGSGIRYVGDGVEYDEHQGRVDVDFKGTQLSCRANQP